MPYLQRPSRDALIDVGVALLCILPLLLTDHLPLSDAPNHLARQFILRDLPHSPQLQQFYFVQWALVPNLALELFMVGVRWAIPLPLAMRLFCVITVLLLFLGTRAVNRSFSNGTSRAYRVVPLLCWGGPMQYGFLGYCLGVGLGLLLFNAWLRLRTHSLAVRVAFLLVSGIMLMICHLAAFGLFAIAVGMRELADTRRFTRILPPLLVLTAIFLMFTLLSPTAGTASAYSVEFSGVRNKIRSLAAIIFFSSARLEGALLAAAVLGLAAALITRTVRLNSIGLGILATMVLAWLVAPNVAMDVDYIDYRLPWAISFFVVAFLVPGKRQWARPFAAWFGFLSVARIALIAVFWLRWEPTLDSIDKALSQVSPGARIMTVVGEPTTLTNAPASRSGFRDPDLNNVASYAVIRRQGFEPGIFASIPGQILELQPHYRDLARADGFPENTLPELKSLLPDYNYVLVLQPEMARLSQAVEQTLVQEAEGPHFKLFKVVH